MQGVDDNIDRTKKTSKRHLLRLCEVEEFSKDVFLQRNEWFLEQAGDLLFLSNQ